MREPERVTLQPCGTELECEWSDGRARIALPVLKDPGVVVLHGAL